MRTLSRPLFLCVSLMLFPFFLFAQGKIAEDHFGEVPTGLLRLGDNVLFPPYALVVDKSKKLIYVIDNSSGTPRVIETYDSDLGKHAGPKLSTGDAKTPEGIYFLQ